MALRCHQVNIGNQGMSEASITLSTEAFGIASLNVLSVGQTHERVPRPCVTHGLPYGIPSSNHTGGDTAVCPNRVEDTT
ncbi:Outer capsid VP4 [Gossypium arboreum]|uniref:Outer capsid VP4 n=1 Tax=Gossypium arboreum TaxID=29729 RepID=A0A0B0MIC6_GOSAR|nr:Outer capsid VP4 [Gossypium arboreum]